MGIGTDGTVYWSIFLISLFAKAVFGENIERIETEAEVEGTRGINGVYRSATQFENVEQQVITNTYQFINKNLVFFL